MRAVSFRSASDNSGVPVLFHRQADRIFGKFCATVDRGLTLHYHTAMLSQKMIFAN